MKIWIKQGRNGRWYWGIWSPMSKSVSYSVCSYDTEAKAKRAGRNGVNDRDSVIFLKGA